MGESETLRIEIGASEMEVDRRAEPVAVAKATGDALDPLDLLIDALGVCIGDR